MAERISLRSLIKPQAGDSPSQEVPGRLPGAVLDSLPLWNGFAEQYGEALSTLLGPTITASIELSLVTEPALRKAAHKPGLLLLQDGQTKDTFLRLADDEASKLAAFGLNDPGKGRDDSDDDAALNGLIACQAAEVLHRMLNDAFGFDEPKAAPILANSWPLVPPQTHGRLAADLTLSSRGLDTVTFQVIFPTSEEERMLKMMDEPTGATGADLPILLEGIVSFWTGSVRDLAEIKPGQAIVLPGAAMDGMTVAVRSDGPKRPLATATLSSERGRHHLKISTLNA